MTTKNAAPGQLAGLRHDGDAARSRFVRLTSLAFTLIALMFSGLAAVSEGPIRRVMLATSISGTLAYGGAYLLLRGGLRSLGQRVFVYGVFFSGCAAGFEDIPDSRRFIVYVLIACIVMMLGSALLSRIDVWILSALATGMLGWRTVQQIRLEGWQVDVGGIQLLALIIVYVLFALFASFQKSAKASEAKLEASLIEIDRVLQHAARIAKGDLAGAVDGGSEVSETIRAMLDGLRSLALQSREAASVLVASTHEIAATARQQEQGTLEQAAAVAQIHGALSGLLDGSTTAARSTEDVVSNVERVQRTTEIVRERARNLASQTMRIQSLLETIKGIANKSEILALNAALEGARAGEVGRGFSLVASQMQRLAESVMDSLRDVRSLVEDIEVASAATLSATDESTKLSAEATRAARQIHATLEHQRGSTGMAARAVEEIRDATLQISAGSKQALSSIGDLTRLAGELRTAIERFRL